MNFKRFLSGALAFAVTAVIATQAFATITLQASYGQKFQARSGTTYTADHNGMITSVDPGDVLDLIKSGAYFPATAGGGKNNLAATTDPAATNDGTQGYAVGSRWINTTSGTDFQLADATTNAAIWLTTGDAVDPIEHSKYIEVPVATINAGGILFASKTSKSYCINSAIVYASGTAATCTSIGIADNGNATSFMAWSATGLKNTQAISFLSGGTYVTPGSYFGLCGQSGKAVKFTHAGSNCTGITHLIMQVKYSIK